MSPLDSIIDEVLFTEKELLQLIKKCARTIAAAYASKGLSDSNPLVLINVLKGSTIFTADLIRILTDLGVPCVMECVCCSSYGNETSTSGEVRMLLDVRDTLEGKHVLIVEDIVDSATTLVFLTKTLWARKPASVKTVVLLDKIVPRQYPFQPDFVVTTVPNKFVIGYGLDYAEKFRGIRDVVVLKKSYYAKRKSKL